MTWEALTGLIMLVVLLGAIFIGVPISFTLLFLAFAFGYVGMGGTTVFDLAYFQTIGLMKEELLAAVPLFIFMGFITEQAGLMERLFVAFRLLLAPVRGALFLVVILTATVFAMATGIVGAAVTVLGIMASPIMTKSNYDPKLSAGTITAGGTLGILIPPSVMLIVMGPVLGVSVADLYAAAFGPGFLLAGLYIAYLMGRSFINPSLGPPVPMQERTEALANLAREAVPIRELAVGFVSLVAMLELTSYVLTGAFWGEAARDYKLVSVQVGIGGGRLVNASLPLWVAVGAAVAVPLSISFFRSLMFRSIVLGTVPLLLLITAALGSILAGMATPTEAAGIGALGALLLSIAYGKFTLPGLQRALHSTMATSSMVLLLAVTSNIFGAVFARLGTANWITQSLLSLQLDPTLMLVLILVLIFLLGWPFEWPAIILVFLPIFYPVVAAMKIDLVWFGALVAVVLQTAFLSPPVAMSAYYLKQVVKGWSLTTIYGGMFQFMFLQVICVVLLVQFPKIATWFPEQLHAAARAQKIPEEHQKILEKQRKAPSLEEGDWGTLPPPKR